MKRALLANLPYAFTRSSRLPIYLILGVTYRCNAHCVTCFNHAELNDPNLMAREMTLEEIGLFSESMGPLVWLLMTGGEPVMRPEIVEIAQRFHRTNGVHNLTIPSGGILTSRCVETAENILRSCPDLRLTFSFALDGLHERHDEIRGFKGNFKKLGETIAAFSDLQRAYPRLSVNLNTCVSNRNLDQIPEILAYVPKRWPSVDFHGFELLRGDPLDKALRPPTLEEYAPIFERIERYWDQYSFYKMPLANLLRAAKIRARQTELETLRSGRRRWECLAGHVSVYIDPCGEVQLCEPTHPIGNLREADMDFPTLWWSDAAQTARNRIAALECSCTHSCFVSSSMMFSPSAYPALLREAVRGAPILRSRRRD